MDGVVGRFVGNDHYPASRHKPSNADDVNQQQEDINNTASLNEMKTDNISVSVEETKNPRKNTEDKGMNRTGSSRGSIFGRSKLKEIGEWQKGETFGEIALMIVRTRDETVKCKENCCFAILLKKDYEQMLGKIEQKYLNEKVEFLLSLPYFKKWTRHGLANFNYFLKPRFFKKSEYVYRTHDQPRYVFIVKSGEFQVQRSNYSYSLF